MQFCDRLQIGKPARTKEGYVKVRARAARTGVYQYPGHQIDPENQHGLRDEASVNVLRDEKTVFDKQAVQTFIGKPVTVDHPSVPVNADNWRDHGRGAIMGALRDGDYLAFDLLLMDASAIADMEAGKKELSNGYNAELEFGDFTAPDGTRCPARQSRITDGNHVALVDAGRAGPKCRIADGGKPLFQTCDTAAMFLNDGIEEAAKWLRKAIALHKKHMNGSAPTTGKEGEKSQMLMMEQMENALSELEGEDKPSRKMRMGDNGMPHTLIIDGLQVPNVSDEAKAAIEKLQGQITALTADKAKAETDVATLTTDKATLEAKVVTLEQQVKDAAITPAKLRDAAKSYAGVLAKAKALGVSVTDEMDESAIQKAVVTAKVGDAAKDWNETQIAASFATLTKDVKAEDEKVFGLDVHMPANDADKGVKDAYDQMVADMTGTKAA